MKHTMSISTIWPLPLFVRSMSAARMPKTAIIPPPAKSAAAPDVSVVSKCFASTLTEQVGGKVRLVALSAEHREDA